MSTSYSDSSSADEFGMSASEDDYDDFEASLNEDEEEKNDLAVLPPQDSNIIKIESKFALKRKAAPAMKEKKEKEKDSGAYLQELVSHSMAPSRSSSRVSDKANNISKDNDTVREVMKQQDFSGSFSLKTLQTVASNIKSDIIAKFVNEHSLKSEAAVITLFVAVVFELKFAAQKSVWDLVMKKAKQWAKKELGVADLTGIESSAKKVLQPLL